MNAQTIGDWQESGEGLDYDIAAGFHGRKRFLECMEYLRFHLALIKARELLSRWHDSEGKR